MTRPRGTAALVLVRPARDGDMAAVTRIYAQHVLNGLATFEESPPGEGEMRQRFLAAGELGLPYLVAEIDGEVAGFAYAAPYRSRPAYRYTVEDSIYLADGFGRRGIGRQLLREIIDECTRLGKRQMIAIIGDSANAASIGVHAALGFRLAGTLPSVGYKLGRWVDTVIMTLALGDGDTTPPER